MKTPFLTTLILSLIAISAVSCDSHITDNPIVSKESSSMVLMRAPVSPDSTNTGMKGVKDFETRIYRQTACFGRSVDSKEYYYNREFEIEYPIALQGYDVKKLGEAISMSLFGEGYGDINEGVKSINNTYEIPGSHKILHVPGNADIASVESTTLYGYLNDMSFDIVSYRMDRAVTNGEVPTVNNINFLNYDMRENRRIAYDDIFLPDTEAQLKQMLQSQLEREWSNMENVAIANKFYIQNDYITFVLMPQEVVTDDGFATVINLPLEMLKDKFTPWALSRFKFSV